MNLYAEETRTLGEIGAAFRAAELPAIRVGVPRALAERAVAAWRRDVSGT